ncbi:MAG: MarR family transcriptional regulator [Gammaproteobacteria bacterium]|nr:MarR family transcriptional regulator [Gammaproteobacteria bacterium]
MAGQALSVTEKLGGAPHSKASLRLWLRLLSATTLIEKRIRLKVSSEFASTLPRFDVLSALFRHPAGLTMGELSKQLLVSNGNVTGVVSKLVDDGLVERTRSSADGRTYFARLTPDGHKAFQRMARIHESWINDVFGALDAAEIEQLTELLARVIVSAQASAQGDSP